LDFFFSQCFSGYYEMLISSLAVNKFQDSFKSAGPEFLRIIIQRFQDLFRICIFTRNKLP